MRRRVDYREGRLSGGRKVARNHAVGAEKNFRAAKNHLTPESRLVEADPRARLGRCERQRERVMALLDAPRIRPMRGRTVIRLVKTDRPCTVISKDYGVSCEVVAEVQLNRPGERDRRAKDAAEIAGQVERLDDVRFRARGRDQGERRNRARRREVCSPIERNDQLPAGL